MMDDLYQAILARRSVRKYQRQQLDVVRLAQVRDIISGVKPLIADNHFDVLVRDVVPGENLVETLGGYGRIVSPPHYLVPYVVGDKHPLTDLGYRVEQIAVQLTALEIGSCYIGSLGREDQVRARFRLPHSARVGAFLTMGDPAKSLGGRAFNTAARRIVGATNKLSADRIFYHQTFDSPTQPPVHLAPLIEAARNAPSASNAQPWRFLWRDEILHLFVQRTNRRYGDGLGTQYRFLDGGICMGNVTLAQESLGLTGCWQLSEKTDPDASHHPANLQLLAKLELT